VTDPRRLVASFFAAMVAHDWDAMSACVTDDVVRIGPYGDVYTGRADYVRFLADLLPTLPGYAMDVARVSWDPETGVVVTELSETVSGEDGPLVTAEAIVCDIDAASGRIARIEVFIRSSRT
jgi:ketosteroid isomerase-like protein